MNYECIATLHIMKKLYFAAICCLMCSLVANAQIKKPELMVFPSDEWCIRNGYFTEVDNMGTSTRVPNYKQALLNAKDSDTIVTGRTVGAPVRVLKNRMSREYVRQEKAGADKMELEKYTLGSLRRAVFEGDTVTGSLMAGQVAGMLHEVRPVAQILADLWDGGRQRIAALAEEC